MHVQIISNASETHDGTFIGKTALVIDVFRTSSTIISALAAGAASIIPVDTIMEAKQLYMEGDVLGGERFCKKIAGFHLGNSPSEYEQSILQGKRLIITTTNGTQAILRAGRAAHVFITGLNNAEASARLALQCKRDIVILCTGSHDLFSIEDGLCAGYIVSSLLALNSHNDPIQLDDWSYAMLALYLHHKHEMLNIVSLGLSGKRLISLNMVKDIAHCAQLNTSAIVPAFHNGMITATTANKLGLAELAP